MSTVLVSFGWGAEGVERGLKRPNTDDDAGIAGSSTVETAVSARDLLSVLNATRGGAGHRARASKMAALDLDVATLKPVETGGFDFGMTARNEQIAAAAGGRPMPQPMSTGTTICGMVYDGGIVLGADT